VVASLFFALIASQETLDTLPQTRINHKHEQKKEAKAKRRRGEL
jgi:hypothetical protein